jgi:hypothetical protein
LISLVQIFFFVVYNFFCYVLIRGRTNTARGGMRTGKSLCLTQPEGNVEVVSKTQPKLHNYSVQGDIDGVRREAFEHALMRLVTQEPNGAWRSSSAALGL